MIMVNKKDEGYIDPTKKIFDISMKKFKELKGENLMDLEKELKLIKDSQLDVELLRRQNEKLCSENNIKIAELQAIIGLAEEGLEIGLKESGEKKLECKLGYISYREMPDSFNYDEPTIIKWIKKNGLSYYHTIEVLEKTNLKEAIKLGTFKVDDIPGLIVTPQEPKFNYKIKGGI